MREVWNDFGLLVFFTTVMVMELEQSNSTAANSWQGESILQLTPRSLCKHYSHYHGNPTIWPLESGNLLAACYHGISFHRAPLSSCTEDNWWCRWGPTPVALFFLFFLLSLKFPYWPLERSRNMSHLQFSCPGPPGPHTAFRPGWSASSKTNYDWFRDNRINIGEAVKVWNMDSV